MNDDDSGVLFQLADAYVAFLSRLAWDLPLVISGSREGRNKFLSNAYLSMFPKSRKYKKTQLVSTSARERIDAGRHRKGLVFEHIVPKQLTIQEPCEELAREAKLTTDFVLGLLRRYWVLATVTTEEDDRLRKRGMPEGWDGRDVFARYAAAGIELVANPFALPGVPPFAPPQRN
jgi:hypothetical protein